MDVEIPVCQIVPQCRVNSPSHHESAFFENGSPSLPFIFGHHKILTCKDVLYMYGIMFTHMLQN